MSSRKEKANKTVKITLVCVLGFAIGYYVLNHISNREDPPLGNTFHIIAGCSFMAVSVLVLFVTLKKHFFPKKKKSKKRPVFLDKDYDQNKD